MNILTDKVKPTYIKLLASAAGSSLIASVFGVIDAMMIGKYHGPDGTAALAVFSPIWSFVYSLGLLAGIGGSVLFANHRGRGNEDKSNEYFTLAVIFGLVISVISTFAISFWSDPMFRFFGADDTLLPLAKQYLACLKFALPCCIFSCLLSSFLRNDGNPTLATTSVIIGGIFNAFGDYFFVFVCDMGIFGAGLATSIGLYISTIIIFFHFFKKENTLRLVYPHACLRKIVKITVNGFPTAMTDLSMGIAGIMFNRQIMKYLNSDALAVYGIITQVTVFAQCCAYGAGQAAQPIISQGLGAKKYGRIKECLKYALYTSAVFGVVWAGLALAVPNVFVGIFMTPTESVLEIAPAIIRVYGISYLIMPFNIFATYYFQSIMKSHVSTISSVSRGALVSGVAIMVLPLLFGGNALWYAMLVTETIVAVYCGYNMWKYTKELK